MEEIFITNISKESNPIPQTQQIKTIRRHSTISKDMYKIILNMKRNAYKPKEIAILTDLTKTTVKRILTEMGEDDKPIIRKQNKNENISNQQHSTSTSMSKRGRKKSENIDLQVKINKILGDNDSITLKTMKDKLKDNGFDISISYLSKTMKKMGKSKRLSHIALDGKSVDPLPSINDVNLVNVCQADTLPPPINVIDQI